MKGYCFFQAVLNLDLYFAAPLCFLVDLRFCFDVEEPGLSGELQSFSSSKSDTKTFASAIKSVPEMFILYKVLCICSATDLMNKFAHFYA